MPYNFKALLKPGLRHSLKKTQSGAATVEVALFIGFFVLFLIILIEMGNYLFTYNSTAALSRDALRYAVVRGATAALDPTRNGSDGTPADAPGDLTTFRDRIQTFVNSKKILKSAHTVNVEWGNGTNERNNPVSVTVSLVYEPISNLMSFFGGTISATAEGNFVY